jgi:hypothetical protein
MFVHDENMAERLDREHSLWGLGGFVMGSLTTPNNVSPDFYLNPECTQESQERPTIGDTLYILNQLSKEQEVGDWSMPVYQVEWHKQGAIVMGYMGLKDVCIDWKPFSDDLQYLLSLVGMEKSEKEGAKAKMKALVTDKHFQVLSSLEFMPDYTVDEMQNGKLVFGHQVTTKLEDSKGLEGIKKCMAIDGSYGACGYTNGVVYLLWDGEKLFQGPSSYGMADADVFAGGNELIFPNDKGGVPHYIYSYYSAVEFGENHEIVQKDSVVTTLEWSPRKGLLSPDTLFQSHLP